MNTGSQPTMHQRITGTILGYQTFPHPTKHITGQLTFQPDATPQPLTISLTGKIAAYFFHRPIKPGRRAHLRYSEITSSRTKHAGLAHFFDFNHEEVIRALPQ